MEVRRRVNFPPALQSLELNSKHCYWIKEEYCGQAGLMAGVFSWTTDLLYWVQCILEDIDLLFMWKTQIKANVLVVKSKRSKFWTYPKTTNLTGNDVSMTTVTHWPTTSRANLPFRTSLVIFLVAYSSIIKSIFISHTNYNPVTIYSSSCCSKPVCLFFLCVEQ